MARVKGPLTPKNPVPLDALQAALHNEDPSGMKAAAADVTGGELGVANREAYIATQAAPLEAAQAAAQDSLLTKVAAAAEETYTGYIIEALDRAYDEQYRDFDPKFDGARHALDILQQAGLEADESRLRILARAGTEEDQIELLNKMLEHEENQRVLSRHGGYAVASGVLDPTTLLVDFATFGASKAFKLGRLASATMGAAAGTGVVGAADISGKSTTGFDYLLNASLTAGAMGLFGGAAANRIANGTGNWYGKVTIPSADGKMARQINAFLSESDKLAATPEAAALIRQLIDDPVRRPDLLVNNNGASLLRRFGNEADGLVKEYDDMLEAGIAQSTGMGLLTRKLDIGGRYLAARDALNRRVAEELLRRDAEWSALGRVSDMPDLDPLVKQLADQSDKLHGRLGEMARDAGVRGFEDFKARPGYFHRSWNDSRMRSIEAAAPGTVRTLLREAAVRGIKGIDNDEADAIAGALIQRVRDKASGMRSDFMGALGKADTAFLRESLENAKVNPGRIDSIMAKVEQKASDQGTVKYGKHRLTLDMGVAVQAADGNIYRMTDLIDTDLDRVMENYASSIAGRSALAQAGVGADDAAIEAFKRNYLKSISKLPQEQQEDLMLQLDGLLGDFTGMRPAENILRPFTQRVKSIADATMLSASGLWQIAEYSTMAARHGLYETGKEFIRRFPGVRNVLAEANRNPDLAEELSSVLHLDLARDVRLRPWKRQHDAFLAASNTTFDRVLHAGKQVVPYLNAMKYVHAHQARMNANLVLNKFARAAKGDAEALRTIREYAPDLQWDRVKAAIDANVTYLGKGQNASSFNWGGWAKSDVDEIMNVALRMMDDSLLYGRAGQGASFARSPVGQVLGQFRSYVSFAHNKLLRGTLNTRGPGALATLLAFQYPLTFLMVSANEARKGDLEMSNKKLKEMAKKAIGYTAGLGFVADAAGIVGLTGGRGGMSTPLLALAEAPGRALGGMGKMFEGEYREGTADILKAASMVVPGINVMPGTALAIDALKGE